MATGFEIGIEEEYQLVDPDTGALLGQAPRVLESGARTLFKPELQTTMVEVDTAVSRDVADAMQRLAAQRAAAIRRAREEGLALAAAGLHPTGIYPPDRITDSPHYRGVAANAGSIGRELHIFGMHVHVAVPDRESAIRAMCGATPYIPHLIALAASSPLHHGQDTGYDSFRTLLRDMFPEVGPPLPIASAAEYERLLGILRGSRFDPGRSSPISWDIRPSPRYPTLEFRFFDACPRLADVAVLAAFARGLTAMFVDRPPPQPTGTELHILRENRWRAARYGLDAWFFRLDPATGEERSARDSIRSLVDRLAPISERLGDAAALRDAERILDVGNAAGTIRSIWRERAAVPEVMEWVVAETAAGAGE